MTTATMQRGNTLTQATQQKCLNRYVHRYTGNHKPAWVIHKTWKDGKPYPLQFATDAEWLANTFFAVRKDGQLDGRHAHCESHPTWPNNPELRTRKAG
jgi:hypothetical protein